MKTALENDPGNTARFHGSQGSVFILHNMKTIPKRFYNELQDRKSTCNTKYYFSRGQEKMIEKYYDGAIEQVSSRFGNCGKEPSFSQIQWTIFRRKLK